MNILWGMAGIAVIMAIAWLISVNRRAVNVRTVFVALAIQILFAFIVLKWEFGKDVLYKATEIVGKVIKSSNSGIEFVFGGVLEAEGVGFIFAFQVLTVIVFFASLIAVLYHLGIMQILIRFIGGGLSRLLKTSKAESISAAANIFVGQTEAPLIVKPYIGRMTKSEVFAVMTGGLATVSGANLAGYFLLGIPLEYLLAASFMAAPGGLLMAKLIVPETEKSETSDSIVLGKNRDAQNVIDAAAKGAGDGLKLALNVGAMLVAFISLIALLNIILGGIGGLFGFENLSLEYLLGIVFAPIAFVMGVPFDEALVAGSFLGQKAIINEFVAYVSFVPEMANLSDKTNLIISFALCGFANVGSTAILLGTIGEIASNQRNTVAQFALRAVLAGTLANLLSAAIAGMLMG